MQAYDAARFDPPAPLALVTVQAERLGIVIHDVPVLLDTGADVSLLPRSQVAHSPRLMRSNTSWKHSTEQRAPRRPSPLNCSSSASPFAGSSCWWTAGTAFWAGMS
jgi:hypothetical protein